MHKRTPAEYTRMRWRNGRGETAMIASGQGIDAAAKPLWRLSLATVTEDGPFSLFPEYTRILTVVSGAGLRLSGADGFNETVRFGESIRFPGALDINCSLLDGPVKNLNLMYTRASMGTSVTTYRLDPSIRFSRAHGQDLFIFCASGHAHCTGAAPAEIIKDETLCIGPADLEGEFEMVKVGTDPATVVLVKC